MNHTQNYNLSQWVKSDQVKMEDFNADNAKIDAAIKAEADARAAETAALSAGLALKGNCQIQIGSYIGNGQCGQEHPTSYTFPVMPAMFIIFRPGGSYPMIAKGNANVAIVINGSNDLTLTWDGNTVSWYGVSANGQYNAREGTYTVVAFYEV